MRILVAEDEPVTRSIVAGALERAGHDVIQASDGLRAWGVLEDNPGLQAVVLDVVMPGLDGRELLQRLRADPRFRELPVVVMSGKVSVREISDLLEQGASRFIAKPVNKAQLLAELRRLVDEEARSARAEYG